VGPAAADSAGPAAADSAGLAPADNAPGAITAPEDVQVVVDEGENPKP